MAEAEAPIDVVGSGARTAVGDAMRRYILILLLIAYTLSFLDRQLLSILVQPIEKDLHIKDTQMGILTGPVFVIFYTFLGVPIARIADRRSRPLIIALSLTIWSAFTALSGRVGSFLPLALARLGVGFGEAGCNPSSHSLIADISTQQQRASGLAFYSLGVPIGTMLGSALGGVLADAFGWRSAFLIAGAPGLVLAAVVAFTVREPRGRPDPAPVDLGKAFRDLAAVFKELSGKPTFWLTAVAAGFFAFVGYAHLFFIQAFFLRVHGPELATLAAPFHLKAQGFIGIATGLMIGAGGFTGTVLGGWVADRAIGRDRRVHMTFPAIAALIAIPVLCAIFLVPTLIAIPLIFVTNMLGTVWYGPFYSTAQSVVGPHSRATAAALLLLILNLIGLGLGPPFAGALSDYLSGAQHMGPAEGLRWALIITVGFTAISVVLLLIARRTVRRDVVS
ncbi:MAG TPA: MFS transporter [Caulobacteraceae bacterium]|jgi:MFS family permease|nr:MFS transporter [Caulobacteraceae bacterium]